MVVPSMVTVGSPCAEDWVSFLLGSCLGGLFSTMLDGVTLPFRVSAHWLPTFTVVGASSLTVPSKRTWTCGCEPFVQCSCTYLSE